jgi:hypothetical protein
MRAESARAAGRGCTTGAATSRLPDKEKEERDIMAEYDGIEFPEPEIRLSNFELRRALQGFPMKVTTTDGQEITLRLATAAELMEITRIAREKLPAEARPPEMDRNMALALTVPVWTD